MNEPLILSLAEARARAGLQDEAAAVAQRLRAQGVPALCIRQARGDLDWLDDNTIAHAFKSRR